MRDLRQRLLDILEAVSRIEGEQAFFPNARKGGS